MHDRNGVLINCLFFFFPMGSLHQPQYWMVPCKEKLRCAVCRIPDSPVSEITSLVSKEGSRDGRYKTENSVAVQELHSVLPSCFKLN